MPGIRRGVVLWEPELSLRLNISAKLIMVIQRICSKLIKFLKDPHRPHANLHRKLAIGRKYQKICWSRWATQPVYAKNKIYLKYERSGEPIFLPLYSKKMKRNLTKIRGSRCSDNWCDQNKAKRPGPVATQAPHTAPQKKNERMEMRKKMS